MARNPLPLVREMIPATAAWLTAENTAVPSSTSPTRVSPDSALPSWPRPPMTSWAKATATSIWPKLNRPFRSERRRKSWPALRGRGPAQTAPDQEGPYQDVPYQDAPYHDVPYHEVPYHDVPYHDVPYHDVPYHDVPNHDVPNHDVPYHDVPYHEDPYQEL